MAFPWLEAGSALAAGIQGAGGIASIFGGGSDGPNGPIVNKPFKARINTPGYTFGGGTLSRTSNQGGRYGRQIRSNLRDIRGQIAPGYGRLTQAVTDQIRNQGSAAVGNLRSSLAQRGLMGASFANDALARVEAEYSQQEAMARAAAFQEEMTATQNIIAQELQLQNQMVTRDLTELGIATSFLSGVNQQVEKQGQMLNDLADRKARQLHGGGGLRGR